MTVEEPTPGFGRGRGGGAEEEKVVRVFVHYLREFHDLAEEVIDPHGS
jgi:hypothetical protein